MVQLIKKLKRVGTSKAAQFSLNFIELNIYF